MGLQQLTWYCLQGHLDWVFGAAWVSDRHLVTGSRDGAMALWNIQQQEEYSVLHKDFNNKKDMKRKFKVGARLAIAFDRKV